MNVLIYGKPGCPACVNAVDLCKMNQIPYDYKVVGSDITKEQLEEAIGREIRTVPQIFVTRDGFSEYVGGYDDFRKMI